MRRRLGLLAIAVLFVGATFIASEAARGDELTSVPAGSLPADELSSEIAGLLNEKGTAVKNGSRTLMEFWLAKEWPLKSAKPGDQLLYPFEVGQLIGVVRFPRKGADFRDQEIAKGVYTLRYAQQPVDGAHVGTSPTRDFLLLLEAAEDTSPKTMEYKPLADLSKAAAQSAHPALLSLQRGEPSDAAVRHLEQHDWWIVRLDGQGKPPEGAQPLALEIVVLGQAAE